MPSRHARIFIQNTGRLRDSEVEKKNSKSMMVNTTDARAVSMTRKLIPERISSARIPRSKGELEQLVGSEPEDDELIALEKYRRRAGRLNWKGGSK